MNCSLFYQQQLYDDASDQIFYHLFVDLSSSSEALPLDYNQEKQVEPLEYNQEKQADNGVWDQPGEACAPVNLCGMPV